MVGAEAYEVEWVWTQKGSFDERGAGSLLPSMPQMCFQLWTKIYRSALFSDPVLLAH